MSTRKYILFDISNLLYRAFFANKSEDDQTTAGLAHHMALMTLNKYFKQFKPHKVVMAYDRPSWRKDYTADEELCISGKKYKGNRRQKMTPKEKEKFLKFMEHLKEFEEIMRVHTSVVCLAGEGLEADDLVAGFVQSHPNDEIILVSADKDMIQLLRHPKLRLIDPATGKDRTLEEWDGDADLFLFEKFLRGDAGDNVQSSYPRIRAARIRKAYTDEYERINMMNEAWTNQNNEEFIVRHLFAENILLMDLAAQPECVRNKMDDIIATEMEDPGKFSHFHFLRFLGKYDMKKLAAQIETFVPMLSR